MLSKVLIVDDSKTIRMQVKDLLPKGNFEVAEATDGMEGLSLIRQERPSLVLLDFFMPKMNGWEVLEQIQTQPDLHDIPVVVMTGRKEEVLEKMPNLFEYFECIEKPFEQKALIGAVKSAMTKAKSRQAPPQPTGTTPATPAIPATVAPGNSADPSALQTEVQTLKAQVQALTQANLRLQAETEAIKKQLAQVIGFVKQKLG